MLVGALVVVVVPLIEVGAFVVVVVPDRPAGASVPNNSDVLVPVLQRHLKLAPPHIPSAIAIALGEQIDAPIA